MKAVKFTNKLYLGFVLVLLSYFLLSNGYALLQNATLFALLPITIQLTVLILIVLRHKWVKSGIKGWSLFFIIGSGLQLIGQLRFLLGDDDEIEINRIIEQLVMLTLGLLLFAFADSSIEDKEDEVQDKEDKVQIEDQTEIE